MPLTLKLTSISLLLLVSSIASVAQHFPPRFLIELNGRAGYIDAEGRVVIEPKYDRGWKFSEGLACVTRNGETGFVDTSGQIVIAPRFESSYGCYNSFREGFAAVSLVEKHSRNGKAVTKWGFVDPDGRATFFPRFTFLSNFREGLAFFHKGGLVGYMNPEFKVVIKPQFKSAGDFYFGRARATDVDGNKFYIDKQGKRLFKNRDGGEFQDSRAFFKVDGKYGFIDLNGHVIIEPKFDNANHFGEGLAGVKIGEKWGFVDERGDMVITPQFDSVGVFTEGLVSVEVDKKWGFVNRQGEMVIPPQFDKWTYYFEDGLCMVRLDGKVGYIDKTGRIVWPFTK